MKISPYKNKDFGRGFAWGIRWQKEYRYIDGDAPHKSYMSIGLLFWKYQFGINIYLGTK